MNQQETKTQILPKVDDIWKMSIILNIDGNLQEKIHYWKITYTPSNIYANGAWVDYTDKIIMRIITVRGKYYIKGNNIIGVHPTDFPVMLNPGAYKIHTIKSSQKRKPDFDSAYMGYGNPCEMIVFTPQKFCDGKFIPLILEL